MFYLRKYNIAIRNNVKNKVKKNNNMNRIKYLAIPFLFWTCNMYGQSQTYTSRIGLKFFPCHWDIAITINNDTLRYELFNHWYCRSYAELRQITVPINEIEKYTLSKDSIQFVIKKESIYLIDKKYGIKKRIKNKKLCISTEKMRKISYAHKIAIENGLMHYNLYTDEDLQLNEDDFCKKVNSNLEILKEKKE